MGKRYYVKHKTASLYLAFYISAIVALVVLGMATINGEISNTMMIAAGVLLVVFSLLFINEIKKGIFDKVILQEEAIVLSRLGKTISLSWEKVEKIDVDSAKNVLVDKNIVVRFAPNSKGETLEIKLEYRQKLLNELQSYLNKRK